MPRKLVSPLDRERADACIVNAVGPMVMPSVEVIRNRLVALAVRGPHARVGLRPSPSSLWWSYQPADSLNCVEAIEPASSSTLDEVVSRIAQNRSPSGVRIYVAGDFLITAVSHGLCDARLVIALQNALLTAARPAWADFHLRERCSAHLSCVGSARNLSGSPISCSCHG